MPTAYLGLGSNLGDSASLLRQATALLDHLPNTELVARASVYQTKPVNMAPDTPDFLNTVVSIETTLSPEQLLRECLNIERMLGRERGQGYVSRTIDIDLLLYDDLILNTPTLTLPHPHFHERAFVLVPLLEIAPTIRHPFTGALLRRPEVVDVHAI